MADPVVQQITQSQTTIPEYARPYVENLLGTTAGTVYQYQRDASGNIVKDESGQPIISGLQPYMQYQGDRVAQFAPLQQQAYGAAQYLAPAGQLGAATDIAATAGLGALGTQYDPSRFRSRSFNAPGTAAGYMSPYMQNVVDVQQREAKRQADIASTARGAQAARAGAFGGSRQAIESAEASRNLQRQLGDIQATGLQSAYNQAQQQFNAEQAARQAAAQLREQSRQFGAGLGMQGLQTGLQAAGQLGNIGQQQFGQEQQAIQTQAGLGQQQQQRMQDILNAQYQDFLNFQNYPYKQLGFMSDMLRGLPLTQQSGTIYGPQPSAVQNLASLGLGAYGLSGLFGGKAAGGSVQSYADGGSVLSQYNKDQIVEGLHPDALPRALQGAMARGDIGTAQSAQEEMAIDAAMRRGIAGALPQGVDVVRAAGGGIVAFAGGGSSGEYSIQDLIGKSMEEGPAFDPEAALTASQRYVPTIERMQGPNLMAPFEKELEEEGAALRADREKQKYYAALEAAGVLGSVPNLRAALPQAAAAAGRTVGKLESENRAANRDLRKSRMQLAAANQARKEGNNKMAFDLARASQESQARAFEQKRDAASRAANTMAHVENTRAQIKIAKERAAARDNMSRYWMQERGRNVRAAEKAADEAWSNPLTRGELTKQGFKSADEYRKHRVTQALQGMNFITDVRPYERDARDED